MVNTEGPLTYRNWKAKTDDNWTYANEHPVFTDAQIDIRNPIIKEFGPFKLFTLNPTSSRSQSGEPTFILRVYNYLEPQLPSINNIGITDAAHYTGGFIAEEVTSLLALSLGVRLKVGDANRFIDKRDPIGLPFRFGMIKAPMLAFQAPDRPILPNARFIESIQNIDVFSNFPQRKASEATVLLRAARLYQEAIWIAEGAVELSWLLLTAAVETIASYWYEPQEVDLKHMKDSQPDLEEVLRQYAKEGFAKELITRVFEILSDKSGAAKKFRKFIETFYPQSPPPLRPPEFAQHKWKKKAITDTMVKIYTYRSNALHTGTPFPAPMCAPPDVVGERGEFAEIPIGLGTGMKNAYWSSADTPILFHTFEYIVRHTILNWWKSLAN
jgi:hypothetical protein